MSSNGLSSVTSGPIAVSPGAAARLVISSAIPANVVAGSPFGFTVTVEDSFQNVVPTYSGNVTVSRTSSIGGPDATLGGTVTVPVVNGMATFSDLTLNIATNGYLLESSSGDLIQATSRSINVSAAPAVQLVVLSPPPSTVNADTGFNLRVLAEDAFGNTDPNFNGPVTLALAGGSPAGASLGGTLTINASNGEALFTGVTLNAAASGASLRVNANGLNGARTGAVSVIAPPTMLQTVRIVTEVIKHRKVKVIVLQFDGAISSTAALTKTNYSLVTVANGKKHPSKGVPLLQPVYNPVTHQVTLRTKQSLVLSTPLHLAINVTGQSLLATLSKAGTAISSAVALQSESFRVESVSSSHTLDALLQAGFRPKYRHLGQ